MNFIENFNRSWNTLPGTNLHRTEHPSSICDILIWKINYVLPDFDPAEEAALKRKHLHRWYSLLTATKLFNAVIAHLCWA